MTKQYAAMLVLFGGLVVASACSKDENNAPPPAAAGTGGRAEQTGAACQAPNDCYKNLDAGTIKGQIECILKVRDGYCTHTCTADTDCCAVKGECITNLKEVCAPFENLPGTTCFLSCEPGDIRAPDGGPAPVDGNDYCQRYAGEDFICRSSGGGNPKQICAPADCGIGADCSTTIPCPTGLNLTCVTGTGYKGGFCTMECTTNASCNSPNAVCVKEANGKNYCHPTCTVDSDCGTCRSVDWRGTCQANVTTLDGTTASVCVPPT